MSKEKWGKVLIIGDTIVDVYIDVVVRGICPEAVCTDVLPTEKREVYLGGAGNIYRQLAKLGTPCMLMTVTGAVSHELNNRFEALFNTFDTKMFPILRTLVEDYKLTTKIRYMCGDQMTYRVSDEETEYFEYKYIEPILAIAENVIDDFEVVLLVDYNKGMMIPKLIQQVIKVAKEKKVPVVSDIKYKNVGYYNNSFVIKCNQKEYDAIDCKPYSSYWIVTNGNKPTKMITGNQIHEINTITNPYFKNANCAGDIFMAGFVNAIVNNEDLGGGCDSIVIKDAISAGNTLASKSLSKIKDKVV